MTYKEMDSPTLLQTCGDDASKWAAAFCEIAREKDGYEIDEGWMIGWFANAIERSSDIRGHNTAPAERSVPDTFDLDHAYQRFFALVEAYYASRFPELLRRIARTICTLSGENPDEMLCSETPNAVVDHCFSPRWNDFVPLWVLRIPMAQAAAEAVDAVKANAS